MTNKKSPMPKSVKEFKEVMDDPKKEMMVGTAIICTVPELIVSDAVGGVMIYDGNRRLKKDRIKSGKIEKVKGYKRKDGSKVRSYYRKPKIKRS